MYQDRVCALVDILGFGELIRRSVADEALRESMNEALQLVADAPSALSDPRLEDVVRPVLEFNAGGTIPTPIPHKDPGAVRGTAFSDTLFLTAEPRFVGILNLLITLVLVGQRLLELGFLVRGGIARGLAVHGQGLIYGPGVVEAYELEANVAVYPRVIASPAALACIQGVEPLPNALLGLFREDHDGFWFLDLYDTASLKIGSFADQPLVEEWVPKRLEGVAVRLKKLRDAMAGIIDSQGPLDHSKLSKLNWAARAFNHSLGTKEALLLEAVPAPLPIPAPTQMTGNATTAEEGHYT